MKYNPINLIGNFIMIIIDCNYYKSYKISIICFADVVREKSNVIIYVRDML